MKKQFLICFLFIFGLFLAKGAQALPISLPSNTALSMHFYDIELVSSSNSLVMPTTTIGGIDPATNLPYANDPAMGNWGVFTVSDIELGAGNSTHTNITGGGTTLFTNGVQGQISGVFHGINFTSGTTATGGYIDLYWNDVGQNVIDQTDLIGSGGDPATLLGKASSGIFLGRLDFATGILTNGTNTTISSVGNPTLDSSGTSDSYANVDLSSAVAGLWTNVLNGDWFYTYPDGTTLATRDIRLSNNWATVPQYLNPPTNSIVSPWYGPANGADAGLTSYDPVRVFTAVPEPGTILLLGAGLLGFAATLRRRSTK